MNATTISFGGILYVRVVRITKGFTMQINLQTLSGLGADFDGDRKLSCYIVIYRQLSRLIAGKL